MKIPLDTICVRSGILCPNCRRKIESGQYEEFEVDVMRVFLELERESDLRWLSQSEYVKAYRFNGFLVVLLRLKGSTRSIPSRIAKILAEKLGFRKVRIIDYGTGDLRYLASQLLFPARVLRVNVVYLPSIVQYNVIIRRGDLSRLPASKELLERVLSAISNKPVLISEERFYR
ncbi:MAG: transcription elongation factor [Desulfurococcales archaeon]|nr:transcription elongation factor [Desulfurococcales archaeon]